MFRRSLVCRSQLKMCQRTSAVGTASDGIVLEVPLTCDAIAVPQAILYFIDSLCCRVLRIWGEIARNLLEFQLITSLSCWSTTKSDNSYNNGIITCSENLTF